MSSDSTPLVNLAKHDIIQLTALVKARFRRMQYKPGLLTGIRLELALFL